MNEIQAFAISELNIPESPGQHLRVNRVQRFCVQDGPGLRTTVFTQACGLNCWWCHNPDTIPRNHPNGKTVPVGALTAFVLRDAPFWKRGGGGLTVSGGECLLQPEGVTELFRQVKAADRSHHCTVDTAGFVPLRHVQKVAPLTDLFLWDFKTADPERFRQGTEGRLDTVLRNLDWVLRETKIPVVLRIPLIKGFNALPDELERMAEAAAALPREVSVEILPGHSVGCELGPEYPDPGVTAEEASQALNFFLNRNLNSLIRW